MKPQKIRTISDTAARTQNSWKMRGLPEVGDTRLLPSLGEEEELRKRSTRREAACGVLFCPAGRAIRLCLDRPLRILTYEGHQ